mmetsp:Transcript_95844/g.256162  ORF Transcript_95844/g.256162 Transcript_95844/m.256162 type:complete len:84 (+) Transcript_95844:862-1113(+)
MHQPYHGQPLPLYRYARHTRKPGGARPSAEAGETKGQSSKQVREEPGEEVLLKEAAAGGAGLVADSYYRGEVQEEVKDEKDIG